MIFARSHFIRVCLSPNVLKNARCNPRIISVPMPIFCRAFGNSVLVASNSNSKNDSAVKGGHVENEKEASHSSIVPKFLQPYLPKQSRGWVMLGSGIVAFGVSRVFYNVTYSFLGLTPAASLYYGFMGGLVTAASSVMVIWWGDQTFRVAPERAVQFSLEHLNKAKLVTDIMGSSVQISSSVRSYSIVHSQISFKSFVPRWISPYVEIAYTVKNRASNKEAIVTCVYGKKGINEIIEYLAFQPLDTAEKIVVKGSTSSFSISESLKSHGETLMAFKQK